MSLIMAFLKFLIALALSFPIRAAFQCLPDAIRPEDRKNLTTKEEERRGGWVDDVWCKVVQSHHGHVCRKVENRSVKLASEWCSDSTKFWNPAEESDQRCCWNLDFDGFCTTNTCESCFPHQVAGVNPCDFLGAGLAYCVNHQRNDGNLGGWSHGLWGCSGSRSIDLRQWRNLCSGGLP